MGRHQEAYEAVAKCSLAVPQVSAQSCLCSYLFDALYVMLLVLLSCSNDVNVGLYIQDSSVIKLTQDLAKMLGLKIRKAYVRSKVRVYCVYSKESFHTITD